MILIYYNILIAKKLILLQILYLAKIKHSNGLQKYAYKVYSHAPENQRSILL